MILRELVSYYDRSDEVAPAGWERKRIPYLIELKEDGTFVQLTSLRSGPRAGDIPAQLVPSGEVRSGIKAFEKPNLLWDHIGFVLGHAKSGDAKDTHNAERQFEFFRSRVNALAARLPKSQGAKAVALFYERNEHLRVKQDSLWSECTTIAGCNVTFRLAGHTDLLVHEDAIRATVGTQPENGVSTKGQCLVTGDTAEIERLHPPIAGVGAKPAPLAAINDLSLPALASFGKHQGENFPVGKQAAFKYVTALNHLLRPDSPQKLRVGSDVAVFWAQQSDPIEAELAAVFGNSDDPDAHAVQVRTLFESIQRGSFDGGRGKNRFFVLGLAPNAGRIAVRFWHACPLKDLAPRIAAWFDDLSLHGSPSDPRYPSLFRLLTSVALQGKADNIPPRLGGDLVRCILEGTAYPISWLHAAVQRCHAEQQVTYLRAASIKACLRSLDRSTTSRHPFFREIQTVLDITNPSTAYRLGRLFATLEKIQEEASPGLNTTIRERYYGAASSTPVAVFTTLMRLKNHHLAKLTNRGRATNFEQLLAEIIGGINDFPAHLPLPEQGRFAIGYYHQRQDFFTQREASATTEDSEPAPAAAAAATA